MSKHYDNSNQDFIENKPTAEDALISAARKGHRDRAGFSGDGIGLIK